MNMIKIPTKYDIGLAIWMEGMVAIAWFCI